MIWSSDSMRKKNLGEVKEQHYEEEAWSGPTNRVFSLTWLAAFQIYWNKRKRLHKKGVQLPQD